MDVRHLEAPTAPHCITPQRWPDRVGATVHPLFSAYRKALSISFFGCLDRAMLTRYNRSGQMSSAIVRRCGVTVANIDCPAGATRVLSCFRERRGMAGKRQTGRIACKPRGSPAFPGSRRIRREPQGMASVGLPPARDEGAAAMDRVADSCNGRAAAGKHGSRSNPGTGTASRRQDAVPSTRQQCALPPDSAHGFATAASDGKTGAQPTKTRYVSRDEK